MSAPVPRDKNDYDDIRDWQITSGGRAAPGWWLLRCPRDCYFEWRVQGRGREWFHLPSRQRRDAPLPRRSSSISERCAAGVARRGARKEIGARLR